MFYSCQHLFNPLNAELNPICYLLALLAHHFLHVSRIRVKSLTLRRALHIAQSRASSFKWEYPLLSLRSSNSFLRLLPCLPVTSIPPCIFPSVTRCRRQFRRKMWPIQFALRLRISCRILILSSIYDGIFQVVSFPQVSPPKPCIHLSP